MASKTYFEGNAASGRIAFEDHNFDVVLENRPEAIIVSAEIKNELSVELDLMRNSQPLGVITRSGLKGFNYTNKEAGLTVRGNIELMGKKYSIDPDIPAGVMDYTFGYLGRKTFWNWAAGSGSDESGNKIGFNFSQGVNETGRTENAFWVNGRLVKIANAVFEYDDLNMMREWKIFSDDGKVKLSFLPEGERSAHINLGIIASKFHQPFGKFSGELNDGGKPIILRSISGFTEEHEAKW
jgi:hypothetical protein